IGTATGYNTVNLVIPAFAAGAPSPLVVINFVPHKVPNPGCNNATDNASNASCHQQQSTTTNSGLSTLDYAIIGVIVLVAIVAIALVMLMRRRGGDGSMDSGAAADTGGAEAGADTYGNTPAAPAEWNENPPNQ
ncbi:MAG: hypothetical protein L3K08_04000, partial [Thermoplasmata archaeon]|nr:hypothetical protein [Thermoplasmata archaeon]